MPPRKRTIKMPDGSKREVTVCTFQTGGEHFSEYLVDDGTVIQMKPVVTEILRIDGMYDANGNPAYVIQSTNVTAVSSPDELKQEEE